MNGDRIVAVVSHILNTPFPQCRKTPITLLLRMYEQAKKIARELRS